MMSNNDTIFIQELNMSTKVWAVVGMSLTFNTMHNNTTHQDCGDK